jgi:hypothetical protein
MVASSEGMMIFESYKGLGYLEMGRWGMLDQ